jgi:hypothetical protein
MVGVSFIATMFIVHGFPLSYRVVNQYDESEM